MMGTSRIRDRSPSRSRRDEETVGKFVGRIVGHFLGWSDGQVRHEGAAIPDGPSDLLGHGG